MLGTVEGRDSVTLVLGLFHADYCLHEEITGPNNPFIEALTCLHPEEKTKVISVQKIRKVGNSLPCVKPEELTVLTDEWRVYAKTDIPEECMNKKDGSSVRVDHYWDKVLI